MTSEKYRFDEDKLCNYEETVTILGMPSFVVHNLASSDFTIAKNLDLSLIGSFSVTVKSSISIPGNPEAIILSDEFTFVILIEPCLVTSYLPTS